MFHRSCFARSILAVFVAIAFGAPANAQTLKSGTLSLVVPFAAGGPSDVAGRIIARVKPNIVFTEEITGNPRAEVEDWPDEAGATARDHLEATAARARSARRTSTRRRSSECRRSSTR